MSGGARLPAAAAAALLASLAGLAAVAADDGSLLSATTSRLSAPAAEVSGALTILELNTTGLFVLEAQSVEVLVEEERADVYGPPPGTAIPVDDLAYRAQPQQRATHADVRGVRAELVQERSTLFVYPAPGAAPPTAVPDAGCVALLPSARATVGPAADAEMKSEEIRGRHPNAFDTGGALAWDPACSAPGWTFRGSFEARLWAMDVTINGTTYSAGRTDETTVGAPAAGSLASERSNRYVFLTVRDGWLRATGAPAVFLASADVRAESLVLADAQGTAPALGGLRLAGNDVEVAGDLAALASRAGGGSGLDVRVTGRLDSGRVDGQAVTVAAPGGPSPDLWLLALVAVPVLAGGAAAWRGGPARRLDRLGRLALAGGPGAAAAVARRSRRLQRHADLSGEAAALRIEALAHAGRRAEALAEAQRLGGWEGALAEAYVHAMAGEAARAVEALRPWRAANADVVGLALRQPAFAAVRRHPEAARWLQGAGP
jgi:hypothetical protein